MRLKPSRREAILLALLAAATAFFLRGVGDPGASPVKRSRSRPEAPLPAVPRIGLDRLDGERRSRVEAGRRDVFAFGAAPTPEGPSPPHEFAPPTPPASTPPPVADAALAAGPRIPPLNLKFIGAVGNAKGVKVAVLLTDRNEVLTGQQGDVVANRYRIERIGIESVDLADVGTGQSRRIPLKGN